MHAGMSVFGVSRGFFCWLHISAVLLGSIAGSHDLEPIIDPDTDLSHQFNLDLDIDSDFNPNPDVDVDPDLDPDLDGELVMLSADDYIAEEIECPEKVDPALFFSGREIPMGTPFRAYRTLPRGFVIRLSSIPGAGLGVFAETFIRRHTWLGEYEGDIKSVEEAAEGDNTYAWKMTRGDYEHHHVDAIDERLSNWLRFINCSRHSSEENVVALMCYGKMYYITTKDLLPGMELLVYYGDEYAKEININVMLYNKPWARSGIDIHSKLLKKLV